jgi:hypothetical protein
MKSAGQCLMLSPPNHPVSSGSIAASRLILGALKEVRA